MNFIDNYRVVLKFVFSTKKEYYPWNSFHIKLNANKSIGEGNLIVEAIERMIYDKLCISTTIHVDPDTEESNGGSHELISKKENENDSY